MSTTKRNGLHVYTADELAGVPVDTDTVRVVSDERGHHVQRHHPRAGWFTAMTKATRAEAESSARVLTIGERDRAAATTDADGGR